MLPRAVQEAPAGPLLAVSDSGASPVLKLAVPNREILVGTPDDPFGRVDMPASIAAVILDGMLERTGRPSRLLGEARQWLAPGGILVVTVRADRPFRRSRSDDRTCVFPGQTLASLLFRSGFEKPEFYRYGDTRLVVARRSALEPPPDRPLRLSVILPVYNEAETFEKTMDLVLAKEIPGIEIDVVIVESHSTDGTRKKS